MSLYLETRLLKSNLFFLILSIAYRLQIIVCLFVKLGPWLQEYFDNYRPTSQERPLSESVPLQRHLPTAYPAGDSNDPAKLIAQKYRYISLSHRYTAIGSSPGALILSDKLRSAHVWFLHPGALVFLCMFFFESTVTWVLQALPKATAFKTGTLTKASSHFDWSEWLVSRRKQCVLSSSRRGYSVCCRMANASYCGVRLLSDSCTFFLFFFRNSRQVNIIAFFRVPL